MKALLLFLLLAPFSDVFSQEWTYFTSSTDGNKYYYKNHSEDILHKKIWIKEVGNKLQRTSKNGKKINFSGYSLMLYNVNCREKSSALIKISYYSSSGTFLNSADGNEFDFSYPNPGTIGESIIEAACDQ
jgi:hypothetical protein